MKKRAAIILLLIAVVFAVYAPALRNGFVWDDTALVLRDPFIRSWRLIAEGFRHFLFTDATASNFYRPLQRLTYTWDYAWFGFAPWGWHLSNIVLHAGAAVMLFLFLEKLLADFAVARARELAGVVAFIWAIHPVHTSAVIYVAGRADSLAALFGFGALHFAAAICKSRNGGVHTKLLWLALPLCLLAAMLSKESGIVAMAICAALFHFKERKQLRGFAAIVVAVLGIYGALRFTAEHETPPPSSQQIPPAARPLLAARAFAEYAGLLVAPVNLHMERDILPFGHGDFAANVRAARLRELQTLLGVTLLAGFVVWMRWSARRDRAAVFCLLAFIITYLPISNLLPLNATAAEHWLYVPSAFVLAAAALSLSRLPLSKSAGIALLLAWTAFLCVRTFSRNADWRDQRTFFERTIADGGASARMLMNLAGLESAAGHQRIAIGHFQNALERAPDQPFALLGLGGAYLRAGEFEKAREQFEKALRHPFVHAEALQDLAVLEYKQSGRDRVDLLSEAAALAPKDWAIQKRYIGHLDDRGDKKEAIVALQKVLETQWWRADSWHMLGDLWARAGVPESAARAYRLAVSYDVHDHNARRKLSEF